jgi:protein-disulfide isomerase
VSSPEFINGLASHRFQGVVHRDFLSGVRAGVNGTPSFFIEGVRFDGVPDVDSLLMAVEAAADAKEE